MTGPAGPADRGRLPLAALPALAAVAGCAASADVPPADVAPIVDPLCDEAVAAGEGGRGQPPFDLVFKVHIEPTSVDGDPPVDERLPDYLKRLAVVEDALAVARAFHARASVHANGEFFEYAHEREHAPRIELWLDAGHHLGVHSHAIEWQAPHEWRTVPSGALDAARAAELWTTHDAWAEEVFPGHDFRAATPHGASEDFADALMRRFGYEVMGGGPNNIADDLLGHEVWNPFRYRTGTLLGEDPDAYAVLVPHRGQVGEAGPHGPLETWRDNTVGHLKVLALQARLEREAAIRHGDPERRWVFGFLHHDNAGGDDGTQHLADLADVFRFVEDTFRTPLPGRAPDGCWATFDDVHARFVAWEAAHPGASSFSYEDGQPYPYHLAGLAASLRVDADTRVDHEAVVADPPLGGVHAHRLRVGPRGGVRSTPGWLLWSEGTVEPGIYDLRAELEAAAVPADAPVLVTDGETGATAFARPDAVPVAAVPVLVTPLARAR